MAKEFKWRTNISSYRYVDSELGSDTYGDGTPNAPYQTLGKAWRVTSSKPDGIVCRGVFSESMSDGNHAAEIVGDSYGNAIFEGKNVYMIYGFAHRNMMFNDVMEPSIGYPVYSNSTFLAGVGRAGGNHSSNVGDRTVVCGVNSSPTWIRESALYLGCIGGSGTAVKNQVVASPKCHSDYKIWFGRDNSTTLDFMTIYDVPYNKRRRNSNGVTKEPTFRYSVFGKVAFILNENIKFTNCFFTSDCNWYFETSDSRSGTLIEIVGDTSQERMTNFMAEINRLKSLEENPLTNAPVFTNCVFSTLTSEEIWNNPVKGDFTLKPNTECVIDEANYYGALPPCLDIPIMDNSMGIPYTWDECTANGLIVVNGNAICINDESTDRYGEIMTKIIKLNNPLFWINGIYTKFDSRLSTNGIELSDGSMFGHIYHLNDTLPAGWYKTNCRTMINGNGYSIGDIVRLDEDTLFEYGETDDGTEPTIVEIVDYNTSNVCYIRSTPVIYRKITSSDGLQTRGVYLNCGLENITYRGRTIVPFESFIAVNNTDTFVGPEGYEIGIMFDDSRVPTQEWIPAQLWGEYFLGKESGVIQRDDEDKPLSSGNINSYMTAYKDSIRKTVATDHYCQVKIVARKE